MRKLTTILFLLLLSVLCGCQLPVVQTAAIQTKSTVYGPRWNDYEGWGKLELGMTKADVLQYMGEPFMTKKGTMQNNASTQTLLFKVRTKYYVVQERVKAKEVASVSGSVSGIVAANVSDASPTIRDRKPEKFLDTQMWGDVMNLFCVFTNGKLTEWYCPEIVNMEKSSQTDSVTVTKVVVTGSK